MWTAARFDADDAVGSERRVINEKLCVLFGVDVVGDHRDVVRTAEALAQLKGECGFARADRAADADA